MNAALRSATVTDLPGSLRDLVELIGLPAALALVEHWGGVIALYVPQEMHAAHPLARRLGVEAAHKLASVYGGGSITIPRAAHALRRARDREVMRLRAEGLSPRDIAPQVGLTERWVWEILRRCGQQGQQQARLPFCRQEVRE